MAKYPYIVIKDGTWYKAGEEVPSSASVLEDKSIKEKKEEFSTEVEQPIVEKQPQPKFTKTDINRMPVDDLRKLAMSTGVEGADKWTGAELKEYLIALMGL